MLRSSIKKTWRSHDVKKGLFSALSRRFKSASKMLLKLLASVFLFYCKKFKWAWPPLAHALLVCPSVCSSVCPHVYAVSQWKRRSWRTGWESRLKLLTSRGCRRTIAKSPLLAIIVIAALHTTDKKHFFPCFAGNFRYQNSRWRNKGRAIGWVAKQQSSICMTLSSLTQITESWRSETAGKTLKKPLQTKVFFSKLLRVFRGNFFYRFYDKFWPQIWSTFSNERRTTEMSTNLWTDFTNFLLNTFFVGMSDDLLHFPRQLAQFA